MTRSITAILLLFLLGGVSSAQQDGEDSQKKLEELGSQVGGLDEAVKELQTDRDALKKFKFSGYIQVNYEKSEKATGLATDPYDSKDIVKDQVRLRRSRLKLTYDGGSTQAVIQGDFSNTGVTLKDAYLEFSEPWLKMFGLRFGVFNRPDYEIEYSSSQRESPERSLVVRTLYPGERDLGAMLTFAPEDLFTLQLAVFNNTQKGTFSQSPPNYGSEPRYFMGRLTRSFALGDLGLDVGVHGRFGNARLNTNKVIEAESPSSGTARVVDSTSYTVGDGVGRNWFGIEAQLYYDFLGGMKLMGEYIMGSDVNELSTTAASPARLRDFSGFYVMFVKNLGTDFQLAAKYDSYTPNTAVEYDKISAASELTVTTLGLGLHNYTFPNVRLTLYYEMIATKTNAAYDADPKDNLLTFRAQYKF